MKEKGAKKKKTINVTAYDIDLGEVSNGAKCPIARDTCRAFKEKLGAFRYDNGRIVYNNGDKELFNVSMPAAVKDFIGAFDSHSMVTPFSFELEYRA